MIVETQRNHRDHLIKLCNQVDYCTRRIALLQFENLLSTKITSTGTATTASSFIIGLNNCYFQCLLFFLTTQIVDDNVLHVTCRPRADKKI